MAPLTVVWTGNFGIEWLSDLPAALRHLPKSHPVTWQRVLLQEFAKRPDLVRVHIVSLRKGIKQDVSFSSGGVDYHVLKYFGGIRAPTLFWADTFLIGRLLNKIKPDLIHAWGSEGATALVARRLNYPLLVTVQGLLRWYSEVAPLRSRDRVFQRIEAFTEVMTMRQKLEVTAESTFAVQYLRRYYPHLEIEQIEHAPDWRFHQIERQPATKPIRFLSVGDLGIRKGTDLLLAALNELTSEIDFEIVTVGKPNVALLASLKNRMKPSLWDRFTHKTNLTPEQIAQELKVATMVLFPTRADTSPNAIKEALVAGVPVIASRVGGIPDYVVSGENGFLFESADLQGFIRAIREACIHPCFRMGSVPGPILKKSRDYLSPATMAAKFVESYARISKRSLDYSK